MKRKVVIIDPATLIGGAERLTADLINRISQKFSVEIITSGGQQYRKLFHRQDVILHHLPMPSLKPITPKTILRLIFTRKAIEKILHSLKPDIIVSNVVRSHILVSPLAAKLNIPLVWMFPDDTFPNWALRKYIDIPRKILPCSKFIRHWLNEKTHGSYEGKIEVLYNGVPVYKTQPPQKSHTHTVIGMIGRIVPWKGQEYFLSAARDAIKKLPDLRFEIIGQVESANPESVDYYKKLQWRIKDWALDRHVSILTNVKNIEQKLQELDILVHASIQPEPFGRVIIEAMNAGVAVIGSKLGGPNEIIHHGTDGLLVDPRHPSELAHAITRVARDPKLRDKLRENGFQTVKRNFDITRIIHQYEEILSSISHSG